MGFVIQAEAPDVDALLALFPSPEFYVSEQAVREAIARQSMFNVVSTTSGDKLDFWMLTDTPFDRERFARRRSERVLGVDLVVSTPEDTILMKLAWAVRAGHSEKQFTDALRVYEVQRSRLDIRYLERWADELQVTSLLNRMREIARPVE